MSLQTLFKLVTCWCALNTARQVVPRGKVMAQKCRTALPQKLFLTGPGTFRRAERKETIDGLDRTSCDSLFHSEMVLGKNEYLYQSPLITGISCLN